MRAPTRTHVYVRVYKRKYRYYLIFRFNKINLIIPLLQLFDADNTL